MSMAEIHMKQQVAEAQEEKTVPPLPHVVWRCIVDYLSDSLSTLLDIASLSPDLRDICRSHISSFFHTINRPAIPPLPTAYYYHHLLRLVLEGYIDASAIYDFRYTDDWTTRFPLTLSPTARPGLPDGATDQQVCRFDHLFSEAVHASPFVPSDLQSEVCLRFQNGDEDAALVVLLPLCTRLKSIEPPVRLQMCAALFRNVADEYQRRKISAEDARRAALDAARSDRSGKIRPKIDSSDALPFSELLILSVSWTGRDSNIYPLIEILPVMGIPSLQRIILRGIRDRTFPGWPAGEVTCSCPEIYFDAASTSKEAILAFAEGLNPPCEIRQWFERPARPLEEGEADGDPTWDRILITSGADGSKAVDTRFDYEGGNPGYDYPWVVWLFNGNMYDWRRIDEEFSFGDTDLSNEWLQGAFR
jgi:hypothetical protein